MQLAAASYVFILDNKVGKRRKKKVMALVCLKSVCKYGGVQWIKYVG